MFTGVTFIRATQNDIPMTANVKRSRGHLRFLKKPLNSSISPVITHSNPPI